MALIFSPVDTFSEENEQTEDKASVGEHLYLNSTPEDRLLSDEEGKKKN